MSGTDSLDYGRARFVRGVARTELEGEVLRLRNMAGQLQAFLDGQLDAWTDADALRLHQAAVRIQSHVTVLRPIEQAARDRAATNTPAPTGPPVLRLITKEDNAR